MKSFILFFISISAVALFGFCKVKSKPGKCYEKIVFGNGGGFTGMVKSYQIDSNGTLTMGKENQPLRTIPSKKLKGIYKKLDQAKAMEVSFENPGNFYYFLYVTKHGKTNRITWSDQNKAPDDILSIYKELMTYSNSEQ